MFIHWYLGTESYQFLPPISNKKIKPRSSNNSKISTKATKNVIVTSSIPDNIIKRPKPAHKEKSKHRRLSDFIYDWSYNTLKKTTKKFDPSDMVSNGNYLTIF